jgi:hypothetical protein
MSVLPDRSGYGDIDTVAAHLADVARRLDELEPNDQLRLLKALGQAADAFVEIHDIFADDVPAVTPVTLKPVRNTVVAASLSDLTPPEGGKDELAECDSTNPLEPQASATTEEGPTESSIDVLPVQPEPEHISVDDLAHIPHAPAELGMITDEDSANSSIIEQIAAETVEDRRLAAVQSHEATVSLTALEQTILTYFQGRKVQPKELHKFIDPQGHRSRASVVVRTNEVLRAIASKTGKLRASGAGSTRRYWLEAGEEQEPHAAVVAVKQNTGGRRPSPKPTEVETKRDDGEPMLTDWGLKVISDNVGAKKVVYKGRDLELGDLSMDVLQVLAAAPDGTLSSRKLLESVSETRGETIAMETLADALAEIQMRFVTICSLPDKVIIQRESMRNGTTRTSYELVGALPQVVTTDVSELAAHQVPSGDIAIEVPTDSKIEGYVTDVLDFLAIEPNTSVAASRLRRYALPKCDEATFLSVCSLIKDRIGDGTLSDVHVSSNRRGVVFWRDGGTDNPTGELIGDNESTGGTAQLTEWGLERRGHNQVLYIGTQEVHFQSDFADLTNRLVDIITQNPNGITRERLLKQLNDEERLARRKPNLQQADVTRALRLFRDWLIKCGKDEYLEQRELHFPSGAKAQLVKLLGIIDNG